MPQAKVQVVPSSIKTKDAKYISEIFGTYLDFNNDKSAHPLIQLYLFGAMGKEELVTLKQEIKWILEGNSNYQKASIEDFLIALDGLQQTIIYYNATTFEEVIHFLAAEKKVQDSFIQSLSNT